ncbi:Uncharacterised protein [Rodentibacter pneumotropicus]|uniref:Uncharacterized protein n=1 Tax=Rodentibacter pneumotropicus TaxID=758 RepID=A0A448MTW3_9PAST|nr:Uncharacterised protein [Rodentibacter pneumotropicus]
MASQDEKKKGKTTASAPATAEEKQKALAAALGHIENNSVKALL